MKRTEVDFQLRRNRAALAPGTYTPFICIIVILAGFAGLLTNSSSAYFQKYLGMIHPIIAVILVGAVGGLLLGFLKATAGYTWIHIFGI